MDKLITDILQVIVRYQKERGLTFIEAIGALKLCADHLSQECRDEMHRREAE